jgi:DNA-binding LytR/AlgR family response regulator
VKLLLVDDEAPARRRLARMLSDYPDVIVVGEAANGLEALQLIATHAPDALLLDVRMPELDGISLALRYAHLPPVIFVTAHDEFAVKAFEVNAVDYLLKPIRKERLDAALAKLRERVAAPVGPVSALLEALSQRANPAIPAAPRVVTSDQGRVCFFEAREISRFWAADKYTLFRAAEREHLTEEPLNALEERLASAGFLRVHRAELVNVAHIRALSCRDGIHQLELRDGQTARVSRRLLGALKARLGMRE